MSLVEHIEAIIFKIHFEKMKTKKITVLITIIIGIQILFIIYENVFRLPYHLGYDASGHFLKATEMHKQGTLFVQNWADSSSLFWDTSGPIAAVMMGLVNNVFAAYGLSNVIIGILILLCLWFLLKELGVSSRLCHVALIISLCPFLGVNFGNYNEGNYFSMIWVNSAPYNMKLLMTLVFFLLIIKVSKEKLSFISVCLTTGLAVLFFLSSISSGYFMLVTVLGPAIAWILVKAVVENRVNTFISRESIVTYIFVIITFTGKLFATNILHYKGFADNMELTGLADFWSLVGGMLTGYLELFYALPILTYVSALSMDGVAYLANFALAVGVLILAVLSIKRVISTTKIKFHAPNYGFFVVFVVYHILMYTVVYTRYAGKFFETRYLIQAFFALLILAVIFVDGISDDLLVKNFIVYGCTLVCIAVTLFSHYYYNKTEEDVQEMEMIKQTVATIDSPVVYMYDYGDLLMNMRPYDTNKIYKLFLFDDEGKTFTGHNADYTYYDVPNAYEGSIILITTPERFSEMPEDMQNEFEYQTTFHSVCMWTCNHNAVAERSR